MGSIIEYVNEYHTSFKTCLSVLGETIEFGIRELTKQTMRELSRTERKERPWADQFERVSNPSGRLTLEIKTWGCSRRSWSDGKKQRIEGCLNAFIIECINTAVAKRTRDLKWAEDERIRQEEELRREKIARLRREEEERVQALMQNAANWQKSKQVREYIEAVKKEAIRENGEIVQGSEMDRWLKWANDQADRLDPLTESPPSILDEDEEDEDDFLY